MPLFDADGFHPDLLPPHFKKDTKDLIALAVVLGWKCHLTTDNSVTIIAPGNPSPKKYHFGLNGRASVNHNRIKRDLKKFADPERLALALTAGVAGDDVGRAASQILSEALNAKPGDQMVDQRPKPEPKPTPKVLAKRKVPVSSESEPERRIVSEQPMMAKAAEGRGYESKVAIERTWSDGSIDYKCVDCDYTTPKRLSIRGHRTRSDHQKRGADAPRIRAEVPNAAQYRPNKNRVAALAEALAEAMKNGMTDPEAIAQEALTWVHEQSKKGTQYADEREPLTAEDTLARIKMLLDDGTQVTAITERDEKIAELQAQVDHTEEQASKLQERVEELESFVELATTLRRKDTA